MKICFLAIGDELLNGRISEANGRFLASQVSALGLNLNYLMMVGDDEVEIVRAFDFLSQNSDALICTGGLGPTPDDLTTEVFAKFAGLDLEFHQEILEQIEARFKLRGMQMPLTNKKQALIPKGARIIPNNFGTAPGYEFEKDGKHWFFFPGVPSEFQQMAKEFLLPRLMELEGAKKSVKVKTLLVYGIPESGIAERLNKITFAPELKLAYLPEFPRIHLRLSVVLLDEARAEKIVSESAQMIKSALGEYVISEDDEPLERTVGNLLKTRGLRLATAESCTGGLVAKRLTDIPGSSDYFLGGFVTYANELKIRELGVSAELLKEKGAVCAEVAIAMAKGARERTGSDIAISTTGVAGPTGGTKDKPVGTVFMALADDKGIWSQRFQFLPISREAVRALSAETALEIIRRRLLNLRMPGERKDGDKQF